MRFKIAGVVLLLAGLYFAVHGWVLADRAQVPGNTAIVEVLIAIFLAMAARVLQAQKHQREQRRWEHEARERALRPELAVGSELPKSRELEEDITPALDRR